MITIESLTVKYKKTKVLDDISLTIKRGQIIALAGKNGAGKSTLLKSIVGVLKPNIGKITLLGSVGYMPESASPDPKLTVHEYLCFCSYLRHGNNILEVIDSCSLNNYKDKYCKTLSKGIKQRVLLAGVLTMKPDILILDEPSGGLDPKFQNEMIEILKNLPNDTTIILSTHNISEINSLATKVIVLKDGTISYSGKPEGEVYYEYL